MKQIKFVECLLPFTSESFVFLFATFLKSSKIQNYTFARVMLVCSMACKIQEGIYSQGFEGKDWEETIWA
jgi:hypothetical protein